MKKLLLIFLLSWILLFSVFALAKTTATDCDQYCSDPTNYDPPAGQVCICNPVSATSFKALIEDISNYFWKFGMALVPVTIIAGAYYLITAEGDPAKIETGKKIIVYTLIGASVVFMSYAIINEIVPALKTAGTKTEPYEIAMAFIDPLFRILVAVALLFIFYSAYTFITAGGESQKIATAKSALIYALIGLGIAFLAKAIGTLFQSI
jgi:hypothetical protein